MPPGVLADGRMLQGGGWQLRRISFVAARHPDAHSTSPAELGLIPLNDPIESAEEDMRRPLRKPAAQHSKLHAAELFNETDIHLQWSTVRRTCLIHTPPLAELFLSTRSLSKGGSNGFDPLVNTRELIQRSLQHRGPIVSPVAHAKNLRKISRSFRLGRQEDAHEYLVALLDAIHESSLAGLKPKPAPELAQTSFIYRIFAGKIRSQVKCTQCGYESNTYDPFLDLSLEITRAGTVAHALERFTAGEVLDGANKYKCSKEKKPVRAIKRMTVHAAPNVLVLQLKRFEFSMSGHKISKKVDFETTLDLSPYMSKRPAVPALYDLYAVLVHSGHSVHSGHYYSFVRSGTGMWHICDDTNVSQVSERMVLGQKAYILFYIKRTTHPSHHLPVSPPIANSPPANSARPDAQAEQAHASQQPEPQLHMKATPQQQLRQGRNAKSAEAAAVNGEATARAVEAAGAAAAAGNKPLQENGSIPQQQQQQQQSGKASGRKRKQQSEGLLSAVAQPAGAGKKVKQGQGSIQSKAVPRGTAGSPDAVALLNPLPEREAVAGGSPEPSKLNAQLRSPLVTRSRLYSRGVAAITPTKALRVGSSRRGKRMAELSSLHRTLNLARQRGKLLQQQPSAQQEQQHEIFKGAAAHPDSTAALPASNGQMIKPKMNDMGKKLQELPSPSEAVVGQSGIGKAPAKGGSSPSASTITAPNWPPVKDGHPEHQTQERQAATAGMSNSSGAEVKRFLQQAAGGRLGLAVEQWDGVDVATKRRHDRLLVQAAPRRKQPDEYDQEYDRGRVKKARHQDGSGSRSRLDGTSFDAAWQSKKMGGSVGGSLNSVQLRGNKLKRQKQMQQQRSGQRHH